MLGLADRNFFGFARWHRARAPGADLLWRVKKNRRLRVEQRRPEGSYQRRIYAAERAGRPPTKGVVGRVIDYQLAGSAHAEPRYRLGTTSLEPAEGPAEEWAARYPERGEIETALDKLKTHRRGAQIVLRRQTPDWVRQEFYGRLLAHLAVRGLMPEAALALREDPDRLSFVPAGRVLRRKLPLSGAIPPSGEAGVP